MCERIELPGGGFAIVCGGHRRRRLLQCVHCGGTSDKLCDHRNGDGRTCDAPICAGCALHVGKDRDYCKYHAKHHRAEMPARLPLEG